MAGPPLERDPEPALAGDRRDHADRQAPRLQDRPLLDVGLQVGRDPARRARGPGDPPGVEPEAAEGVGHRHAVGVDEVEERGVEPAGRGRGSRDRGSGSGPLPPRRTRRPPRRTAAAGRPGPGPPPGRAGRRAPRRTSRRRARCRGASRSARSARRRRPASARCRPIRLAAGSRRTAIPASAIQPERCSWTRRIGGLEEGPGEPARLLALEGQDLAPGEDLVRQGGEVGAGPVVRSVDHSRDSRGRNLTGRGIGSSLGRVHLPDRPATTLPRPVLPWQASRDGPSPRAVALPWIAGCATMSPST